MNQREIYLAGGCYWGTEKYMSSVKGVLKTEVGFANGKTEHPTYQQVCKENTDHAETVHVTYDADALPLKTLLSLFWKIIDPTSINQQGEDIGRQYRTGVYYCCPEDREVIQTSIDELQKNYDKPIAVEVCPLEQFWPAEEYHQKYLDKNPNGYCHVPWDLIDWVGSIDPKEYQ
ncbi:MAG: peptide-methionine (S)-S-oxide reductase MsrA [Negativibacillus sp.]